MGIQVTGFAVDGAREDSEEGLQSIVPYDTEDIDVSYGAGQGGAGLGLKAGSPGASAGGAAGGASVFEQVQHITAVQVGQLRELFEAIETGRGRMVDNELAEGLAAAGIDMHNQTVIDTVLAHEANATGVWPFADFVLLVDQLSLTVSRKKRGGLFGCCCRDSGSRSILAD